MSTHALTQEARQLEKDGELSDAAGLYQRILDADPQNQEALARLLVIYRKEKDYRKELSAIDTVLAAYEAKGKDAQAKWLKAHPSAAGVGKSMLRQFRKGGMKASVFELNPLVERLTKRRAIVERRITGKKSAVAPKATKAKAGLKRHAAVEKNRLLAAERKAADETKQKAAAEAKRKAAVEAKRKAAETKRNAAAAAKQKADEAKKRALLAKMHPSLFVISLHYIVPLEKIYAAMKDHVAYLNQHFEKGDFLVSGRQVPRTGGIIISRGRDRAAVEKIVKQDPFVRRKFASVSIVEFSASQAAGPIKAWLRRPI